MSAVSDNWKVLIVDDETSVHTITQLALADFEFEGKGVELISSYSAEEAKQQIAANEDTAIALIDVVMETSGAGLNLIDYIRNDLSNKRVRLILRTGQPGYAPEMEVVKSYDINDYREKTELTAERLLTTVYSALRSFRDIVGMEKLLDELNVAKVSAESANQAKTAFLATASHELRTPLNAIMGMSEMIHGEAFGPIGNEKYKEYAWNIVKSGENLLAVVQNILDMAHGTVSALPLNEEEVNIGELVKDTLLNLNLINEKKSSKLNPKTSSLTLLADRIAVQRMLIILLSNAVKFSTEKLNINVLVRMNENAEVELCVTDDGRGFSTLDLDKLTTPFSGTEQSTIADGSGLGLGLSVARELIERHGGHLKIRNRAEGGAEACLIFPKERVL